MKLTAYIHAEYDPWAKSYRFQISQVDMSPNWGPVLATAEVEFDPPPHDVLVNGTIKQYREMQTKILAEAQMKHNEIEKTIQEMLCIECKE